ncbi:MAG: DUF58 domain-containing protein [Steroidobacteraceae bacterium]
MLARRGAAWIKRRQGTDSLPVTVHARRLYILPTRTGVGFGALLLFMLLAGLNYSNSLALFLTFLLAGFAIVGMHLTHRNLLGLRITMTNSVDGFARETGRVILTVANDADATRFAIRASADVEDCHVTSATIELPARGQRRLELEVPLAARGRVAIARIRVATQHPFGFFEAWTWLHLPLALLAYPIARGPRAPPAGSHGTAYLPALQHAGDDEWSHLRSFRDGDSPRQVAWRAYASTGQLLVKEYESPRGEFRVFDFDELRGLDLESRLQQLSAWVVAAHARGERYGLRLTNKFLEPADGLPHRNRCLAELAVVGLNGPMPS